jgi:hypothetical protein
VRSTLPLAGFQWVSKKLRAGHGTDFYPAFGDVHCLPYGNFVLRGRSHHSPVKIVLVFLISLSYFSSIPPRMAFYYPKKKIAVRRKQLTRIIKFTMHFYDFLQLDETEQLELLWYNGEQIGRRKEEEHLILLYQVEGFYVEVFYNSKERAIKKYVSFESVERLEPYLEKIDISSVYRYMKKQPRGRDQNQMDEAGDIAVARPEEKKILARETGKKRKAKTGFWNIFLSIFKG